jgi:hypothetical protein
VVVVTPLIRSQHQEEIKHLLTMADRIASNARLEELEPLLSKLIGDLYAFTYGLAQAEVWYDKALQRPDKMQPHDIINICVHMGQVRLRRGIFLFCLLNESLWFAS